MEIRSFRFRPILFLYTRLLTVRISESRVDFNNIFQVVLLARVRLGCWTSKKKYQERERERGGTERGSRKGQPVTLDRDWNRVLVITHRVPKPKCIAPLKDYRVNAPLSVYRIILATSIHNSTRIYYRSVDRDIPYPLSNFAPLFLSLSDFLLLLVLLDLGRSRSGGRGKFGRNRCSER